MELVMTLDTDWAPDCAIDEAAALLREHGVRATWFITHLSPAVERLRACELFEIGVHPNFLPGSTHGASFEEVLEHCTALAPEAVSFRTHGLLQSTRILWDIAVMSRLRIDASMWMPDVPFTRPAAFRWRSGSVIREIGRAHV